MLVFGDVFYGCFFLWRVQGSEHGCAGARLPGSMSNQT